MKTLLLLLALPLWAQHIRYNQIEPQDRQSTTGNQFQMTKSTGVHSGCVQYDADGNIFGTALACSSSTGTVTSIATTSPITGGTITTTGTIACATCVTSAASLTSNLPVFGAGSQATAVGTRSGNTTEVATVTGSTPSGNCAKWDANGNIVDAGAACSSGSGGFTLIEQHTATAGVTSELDFTTCISSTYDDYQIRFTNIVPGTSTASLQIQMGTGGGPTYDTGANYSWAIFAWIRNSTGTGGTSGDTSITAFTSMATTASWNGTGQLNLHNPASSTLFKNLEGVISYRDTNRAGTDVEGNTVAGSYNSNTAVTAFRAIISSGTFSGIVRCYGLAK